MPFFEIKQTVIHSIIVRADDEDQADEWAGQLGDDDFTDRDWGDTTLDEIDTPPNIGAIDDIRRGR